MSGSKKHPRPPPEHDPDDIAEPPPSRPRRTAAERGGRAVAALAAAERAEAAAERAEERARATEGRRRDERSQEDLHELIERSRAEIAVLAESVRRNDRERAFVAEAMGAIDLVEAEENEAMERETALIERNTRLAESPAVDARVEELKQHGLNKDQLKDLLAALPADAAARTDAQQIEYTSISSRLRTIALEEANESECRRLREYWSRGAPRSD